MSGERYARREFLVRAGRTAAGASALVALPGWLDVRSHAAADPKLVELAGLLQGQVVVPSDAGYDAARKVYFPRYDTVGPRAVVFCETDQDVWRTVRWSRRDPKVHIVPRSGGHSYAGYSTTTGVVVDVSRMNAVTVNAANGTASVGAGARLVDVYEKLSEHGVAIPAGSCPTVGIAGLALGGGHGFSGRKFGLTCDNVRSVTIAIANGQLLLANTKNHPDLYWACRGGGAGQFGIVTRFVFDTHPVGNVVTYRALWDWSDAAAIVAKWQTWAPSAADDLFSMCDLIATGGSGGPLVASNGQYFGSEADLNQLLQQLTAVAQPRSLDVRTRSFFQAVLDWANCPAYDRCRIGLDVGRADFLAKSDYVATPLPSSGIQTMIHGIEQRQFDPALGAGAILMDAYGGAINRVPKAVTAFVHRDQLFSLQYTTDDASAADANWLRSFRASMQPFVSGQAYQNYIDPELDHPNLAYYGSNYARLRTVKSRYDAKNVFRFPRSVVPG